MSSRIQGPKPNSTPGLRNIGILRLCKLLLSLCVKLLSIALNVMFISFLCIEFLFDML